MNTYFAYVRVSTQKQKKFGVSPQAQRAAITAYAKQRNLEIVGWFRETATAGKRGRREFNNLVREIDVQRVSGVIFHRIDRGARNIYDWADINGLIDRGLDIRFVHENLDLKTRGGRLTADIQAVVAADFVRNNRDECIKGMNGRLEQGLYPWRAPRGYRDEGKGKVKTIDPTEGPLVRMAFELYATGNYGFETLREELFRLGLRARGSRKLALDAMSRMLRNPFYIGIIHIKRTGKTYQGRHEPLVQKALFDRVQAHLSGRVYGRPLKHDLTFRRLLRCAACGYALIGEIQKGHAYYRCHSKTCSGTSVRSDAVSASLAQFFGVLELPIGEMRDLRDLVEEGRIHRGRTSRQLKAELQKRLGQNEARLFKLTDALLDGVVDEQTYQTKKLTLLQEKRGLNDQLEAREEEPAAARMLRYLERGQTALLSLQSENPVEVREVLNETTSNLRVDGKKLVVEPRFPFGEVATRGLRQNCAHLPSLPRTSGTWVFEHGKLIAMPEEEHPGETHAGFLGRLSEKPDVFLDRLSTQCPPG
jgi:site-specific DNA recombinase